MLHEHALRKEGSYGVQFSSAITKVPITDLS